jgi:hypothetical protein
MSRIDPVHALTLYCLKIHLNIIFSSINKKSMKNKDLSNFEGKALWL